MDKQILFLYTSLNGYLGFLDVNSINRFENLFFNYYENSIFYYPLKNQLSVKNNKLDVNVVTFLIYYFSKTYFEYFGSV